MADQKKNCAEAFKRGQNNQPSRSHTLSDAINLGPQKPSSAEKKSYDAGQASRKR